MATRTKKQSKLLRYTVRFKRGEHETRQHVIKAASKNDAVATLARAYPKDKIRVTSVIAFKEDQR